MLAWMGRYCIGGLMFTGAARGLFRQPLFTLAAVGTLAIGMAAPTVLFSTINATFLQPLPYQRADDIYTVRTYFPDGRFTIGLVSSEELRALQDLSDHVGVTAAALRNDAMLATGNTPREVIGYGVSGHFFDLFGVPMASGRSIRDEDAVLGAEPVAVLSHALWISAYGGHPGIVGALITLSGFPARVVGIAPASFDVPSGADLWVNTYVIPGATGHMYEGFVRLKPGATRESFQRPMTDAMAALALTYPDQNRGRAFRLTPLLTATVGDLGPVLVILFGSTGLLLMLAAANVTNLMLTRSADRARELAVRAALGASAGRIVTELLVEAFLLSFAGGVVGVAIAYVATRLLIRFGGSQLPRMDALAFDGTVMVFVAMLVLIDALAVGIVPGLRSAKTDIGSLVKQATRNVRGSKTTQHLVAMFSVAEVAVAVALVAAAGRLVQSYVRLVQVDPGFIAEKRLVVDVRLPWSYANAERWRTWWDTTSRELRAAGATHVAASSSLPLEHEWDPTAFFDVVGRPAPTPEQRPNGRLRYVTSDWFSTLAVRIRQGRFFDDQDGRSGPAVVIVNETFVKRFLNGRDPLREHLTGFGFVPASGQVSNPDSAIVGVVADVRYAGLSVPAEPTVYVPMGQYGKVRLSIVITTADGRPERQSAGLRAAVLGVDRNITIDTAAMTTLVANSLKRQRLGMWLMSAFGVAAIVLATVGIFGVIGYMVAQRAGEMAIRKALGASRARVFWIIVSHAGVPASLGVVIGVVLAWWTGNVIGRYVYAVRPGDPVLLSASAAIVLVVVAGATMHPAVRAAFLEPAAALRQD